MLQVIRLLAVALCTCGWLASSEAAAGPLRVATLSDYPPYAFLGPDGKPRGWMPDLWAEWSRHTGIAVQLIPSSWPEAVARFESGGSDVLDCIAVTPERAQRMDFIPPLLHVEAHVFIERPWHDAADPGLLRSLRGLLVGVVDRDDAALRLASADPALKLPPIPR